MRTLKILLVLMAVMVSTGLKAADTLSVRDLTYQTINIDTANITFNDSITESDAVLADYRANAYAKGYKLIVNEPVFLEIIAYSGTDTYSYLFNEEFEVIDNSDDYESMNTGYCMALSAGVYYWVVTPYSVGTANVFLTVSIEHINAVSVQNLTYTPIAVDATIEDSLTENAPMLMDVRAGHCAHGYTFTIEHGNSIAADIILDTKTSSWDSYLYLLNDKFHVIARNDDADNGSRIFTPLNAGTYYILVTQYDKHEFGEYSLTLQSVKIYDYDEITYAPVVPDTVFEDSLTDNSAKIRAMNGSEIVSANGYSVVLSQGDMLELSIRSYGTMPFIILDADFNVLLMSTSDFENQYKFKAGLTGTYYVLVLGGNNQEYSISFTLKKQVNTKVYYVDAVNGSNDNSGTGATEAFASLDYVWDNVLLPDSAITCYLMSDIKLNKGKYEFDNIIMNLCPYEGKNITISSDTCLNLVFDYSYVEMGDKDSGTITFTQINDTIKCLLDVRRSNFTCHNVNIHHVIGRDLIALDGSNIVLNNCNIENNSLEEEVILGSGNLNCNNCSISHNTGYAIVVLIEDICKLNNTHIVGNKSVYPTLLVEYAELYINNGVMDSNESYMSQEFIIPDTMITAENTGGIMTVEASLHVNGNYTMNNNYILLLNGSVVTCGDNITAEQVGVIVPLDFPTLMAGTPVLKRGEDSLLFNYYEGLPVLAGEVYANYKRFGLHQPGQDTTWYIISDGTLAMQEDVAVEEAANDEVNIYPNPTSGMLYIHTQGVQATSIRLVDIQGRIICSQNVENESVQLNMQSLAHGMYFVQIMSKEGVLATRKVVKK